MAGAASAGGGEGCDEDCGEAAVKAAVKAVVMAAIAAGDDSICCWEGNCQYRAMNVEVGRREHSSEPGIKMIRVGIWEILLELPASSPTRRRSRLEHWLLS
jgi:hypothetical protein